MGIDHSSVMIEQARARLRKLGLEARVELHLAGVEALAALRGPFDKILSVNLVQFVADKPALFQSFYQLLAPGGRIATTYMPRHRGATGADARRTAEELAGLTRAAGIADVRIEELPLKPLPAVCVLGSRPR